MTRGKLEVMIVGAICLVFCFGIASEERRIDTLHATIKEQEITIEEQGAVLAEFKSEDIELRPCMLCKEQVELYPINNSFYIECPNCHLKLDTMIVRLS